MKATSFLFVFVWLLYSSVWLMVGLPDFRNASLYWLHVGSILAAPPLASRLVDGEPIGAGRWVTHALAMLLGSATAYANVLLVMRLS